MRVQWKLNINTEKTKLIKTSFYINNVAIENVKTMKCLGFIITAKNGLF